METGQSQYREILSQLLNQNTSKAMVLQVWYPALQHQQYLGACCKCKFPDSTSDLLNHRL